MDLLGARVTVPPFAELRRLECSRGALYKIVAGVTLNMASRHLWVSQRQQLHHVRVPGLGWAGPVDCGE